jgi:hypothetical protein
MIKNFIIGCGFGCLLIGGAGALGWGLGSLASNMIFPRVGVVPAVPTVQYCIKGKLYERVYNTYVSVEEGRTCIPIDHD